MPSPRPPRHRFSDALRTARRARGLSQEAFSLNSSRTYVSTLERGLKMPTLSKVDELSEVLELHPLTLLTLSYLDGKDRHLAALLNRVTKELAEVWGDEAKG